MSRARTAPIPASTSRSSVSDAEFSNARSAVARRPRDSAATAESASTATLTGAAGSSSSSLSGSGGGGGEGGSSAAGQASSGDAGAAARRADSATDLRCEATASQRRSAAQASSSTSMPRSASIGVDGVRGGMGATAGMRTASGVETFGVETFGGDALKRAGGGVDGRGGVRGLGGGDVASAAALLTGRSGERTRCAPERKRTPRALRASDVERPSQRLREADGHLSRFVAYG